MHSVRQARVEPTSIPPASIILHVPRIPVSVNHYKRPVTIYIRGRQIKSYALTPEAIAFKQEIAVAARGAGTLSPATDAERKRVRYGLYVTVILGPKQYGDGDNFWKCIGDGLQEAGVIHSDARVRIHHIEVVEDERKRGPRTEIMAKVEPPRPERRSL